MVTFDLDGKMEKRLLILLLFAGFCSSQDLISEPPAFGTSRNEAIGSPIRNAPPPGIQGTGTRDPVTVNNRPLVNLDNYQPQVTSSVLKFIADIQTSSLENAITIQAQLNELAYSQTPLIPDPRFVDTSITRVKRQAASADQPGQINQPSPTSDDFFNFLTTPTNNPSGVLQPAISRSGETSDLPRRDGPRPGPNTIVRQDFKNVGSGSQPSVNNDDRRTGIKPPTNRQAPGILPSNIPPYVPYSGPQRSSIPATPGPDRRPSVFRNPSFSLENDETPPIIPDPSVTRTQPSTNLGAPNSRPSPPPFVRGPSPDPARQYNNNRNQQDTNRNQGDNLPVNRTPTLVRVIPPRPPNNNQRQPATSGQRPASLERPPLSPQTYYNLPPGQPRPPLPFNNQIRRQAPNIQKPPRNDAGRPRLPPLRRQPPRGRNVNPPVLQNNSPNDNRIIQTPVWRLPLYQNSNTNSLSQRNSSRTVPGPTYIPQIVNWPNIRDGQNAPTNQGRLTPRQPSYIPNRLNRSDWFDQYDREGARPTYQSPDYNIRYPYPYNYPYTPDKERRNQFNPTYESPYGRRYPDWYQSRPTPYPNNRQDYNWFKPRPTQYPNTRQEYNDRFNDPYRPYYGQGSDLEGRNVRQPYVIPSRVRGPQPTRPNIQNSPYRVFPPPESNGGQYADRPIYRDPDQQRRYANDPRVSNRISPSDRIGRPPAISTVAGEEEFDVPYSRVLQNLQRYQNLIPTPRGLNKKPSYIKALNVIRSFIKGEAFVYNGYIVQNFYTLGDYKLAQEHFRTLPNVNVTYLKTDTYSGYTGAIQNYRVTLCKECGLGKRYPVIEIVGLNKVYPGVVKRFLYVSRYDPLFDPLLSDGKVNKTVGPTPPPV